MLLKVVVRLGRTTFHVSKGQGCGGGSLNPSADGLLMQEPRASWPRTARGGRGSPRRKGSRSTSACVQRRRSTAAPCARFRSSTSERFPRARLLTSPGKPTRSTRSTCAPKSARTIPQNGPGARPASSTTLTPCRAIVPLGSSRRSNRGPAPA